MLVCAGSHCGCRDPPSPGALIVAARQQFPASQTLRAGRRAAQVIERDHKSRHGTRAASYLDAWHLKPEDKET
jgi:hypothetical protein